MAGFLRGRLHYTEIIGERARLLPIRHKMFEADRAEVADLYQIYEFVQTCNGWATAGYVSFFTGIREERVAKIFKLYDDIAFRDHKNGGRYWQTMNLKDDLQ